MGILVFLLAVVPVSEQKGGFTMHLLRAESPGPDVGKLVPKMRRTALILYGIAFLFVEKLNEKRSLRIQTVYDIDYKTAILIGAFQCLSLIPGTSRSGSTILGAILLGVARPAAAEFSFFLAVPTMLAATVYKVYDLVKEGGMEIITDNLSTLLIGNAVAFIVALLAIKFFIGFVTKYGFKAFGWYRILVGGLILALLFTGHNLTIV